MHPALEMPSILITIFSYVALLPGLDSNDLYKRDRASCLAGALTCTRFTPYALCELWRSLDDIQPLFKTIPHVKRAVLNSGGCQLYSSEYLTETDLKVMKQYAGSVNHLRMTIFSDMPHSIEPSLWKRVNSLLGAASLLPCLRSLEIYQEVNRSDLDSNNFGTLCNSASYLEDLITPSLRRFSIQSTKSVGFCHEESGPFFWPGLDQLFHHLARRPYEDAKQLQLLKCSFTVVEAAIKSLKTLPKLATLLLEPDGQWDNSMQITSVCHLTGFASLRRLCVCLPEKVTAKSATVDGVGLRSPWQFERLEDLEVFSTVPSAGALFEQFEFPKLQNLVLAWRIIDLDNPPSGDDWTSMLVRLTESTPALTSLNLDLDSEYRYFSHGCGSSGFPDVIIRRPVSWSDLYPLLNLDKLVKITINSPLVEGLTNDDLSELAGQWPGLETLKIVTWGRGMLDHQALLTVYEKLVHLRQLVLLIDVRSTPEVYQNNSPKDHPLTILEIPVSAGEVANDDKRDDVQPGASRSALEEYRAAMFLDNHFPHLNDESVDVSGGFQGSREANEQVKMLLKSLKHARKTERSRIQSSPGL